MSEDVEKEADRIEEQTTPSTPVIYETVRRNGEQELSRPPTSLFWSGIAAGGSISFSVLAKAILLQHLPADVPWRDLVASLGYVVGFLMVVLSRQQLFTENTITVVLPVMAEPSARNFGLAARLWAIVLAANLIGTLLAALAWTYTPVLPNGLRDAILEIGREAMHHGTLQIGFGAVIAGYLMAATVWLMPAAGTSQFHMISVMTYLIGAGGFAHIIAGSAEVFMLVLAGETSGSSMLFHFALPALAGNIIGGTALFALLAHAQVKDEIDGAAGGQTDRSAKT